MSDENKIEVASVYLYGPKAKEAVIERVKPAGVVQNTLYLQDTLGVRKLDPFRAFIWASYAHLGKNDGDGKLSAAKPFCGDEEPGYFKRYATILLVSAGSQLIPAAYTAFKAMARPFEKLDQADPTSLAPDVLKERGEEWQAAAEAADVRGRRIVSLGCKQEGKTKYNAGTLQVFAPTKAEVERFNAFAASDKPKALAAYFAKVVESIQKLF